MANGDLCIDLETTTHNKGSPFDTRNQVVAIAYGTTPGATRVVRPTEQALRDLQGAIEKATTLVGFNFKFDLHWLHRLGIKSTGKRVYDCQAAEFVLNRQLTPYPSLNQCAAKYLQEQKIDKVKEYWDQGVGTENIPWETLEEYAAMDVNLTLRVKMAQELVTPQHQVKLISLVNQDLLVLEEMEYNGLKFDRDLALSKADDYLLEVGELQRKHSIVHNVPCFNWNSTQHLSALLYGGTITDEVRLPVGHYKTGAKAGQTRFKLEERVYELPRLFKPIKGTELKKEKTWSTDEDALNELEGGNQELLTDLLRIKKIQKEVSTYLKGYPKKQDEGHYFDYIYGQFNQCVTDTGRLSSKNPNLQNQSEEIGRCIVSRFNGR